MKNILLLLIYLLLSNIVLSQCKDPENYIDENGLKQGCWVTNNVDYRIVVNFKDDKYDGKMQIYFIDRLEFEICYKNGKKHGKLIEYKSGATGDTLLLLNFINDTLQGEAIDFYYGGGVFRKGFYDKGKLEGKDILYYKNGNIEDIKEWRNGFLIKGMSFYKNGNIKSETSFVPSHIHKTYYKNGKRKQFKDENIRVFYDKAGKPNDTVKLKPDNLIGHDTLINFVYKNIRGKDKKTKFYKVTPFYNGVENGIIKTYYPNGILKDETYVDMGTTKKFISYKSNGKLKNTTLIEDGKMHFKKNTGKNDFNLNYKEIDSFYFFLSIKLSNILGE